MRLARVLRAVGVALLNASFAVAPAQGRAPPALPRIDASYRLDIGTAAGRDELLFSRISDAIRLSTGQIVVADQGSNEIRWFSSTGSWIRTVGREGRGPGEYQGLRRLLLLPGDSILAEDGITGRMTVYDRNGRMSRSWTIAEAAPWVRPPPIGRLPDGSFVAVAERALTRPPGHLKYVASVLRYDGGRIRDTIGQVPGGESYNVPCGPNDTGMCNIGIPYGVRTVAAVSGDRVFIGNGDRYELVVFDPISGRADTIARAIAPAPLSAARIASYRDSVTAGMPPDRKAIAVDRLSGAPSRRTMPFFTQLVADDAGRLWLARPQEPAGVQRDWDVLTTSGVYLGTLQLPSRLNVTHIAGGHVVGITRDNDGVERVQVLRFSSP